MMSPAQIFKALAGSLEVIKHGIGVGKDVTPIVTRAISVAKKGEKAPKSEVDQLVAQGNAWHEEFQRQRPPEEE